MIILSIFLLKRKPSDITAEGEKESKEKVYTHNTFKAAVNQDNSKERVMQQLWKPIAVFLEFLILSHTHWHYPKLKLAEHLLKES